MIQCFWVLTYLLLTTLTLLALISFSIIGKSKFRRLRLLELFLHETGHALCILYLSVLTGDGIPSIYVFYKEDYTCGATCTEYLETLTERAEYRRVAMIARAGFGHILFLTLLFLALYNIIDNLLIGIISAILTGIALREISIYIGSAREEEKLPDCVIARHPDRYDYEADLARIKEGKWRLSRIWNKGVPNEMKPTAENPELYDWKD